MKNVKCIFAAVVCVGIIYVLDAIILEISYGLVRAIPRVLPLGGYVVIVYMYLIPVLSISIIALTSGFVFGINLKVVLYIGAIAYVVLDCLMSIKHYAYASLHVTKSFSLLVPTLMLTSHSIVLAVALINLRKLHLIGRKLRQNIRERSAPN